MKAEERKEIESNVLLGWMSKTWENLKSGSGYSTFLIIALILTIVLGYRFFSNLSAANNSVLWFQVDAANSPQALQAIVDENADSTQALIAQLYQNRILLSQEGLQAMATSDKEARAKAADNVEKARDAYIELAPKLSQWPALQSEAFRAAAEGEEGLIGVPRKDAAEGRGNIDRVVEWYAKAATILPESEASKAAGKRAEDIKTNKEVWLAFYKKLNDDLATRKAPAAPAPSPTPTGGNPTFPGLPPGFIPGK